MSDFYQSGVVTVLHPAPSPRGRHGAGPARHCPTHRRRGIRHYLGRNRAGRSDCIRTRLSRSRDRVLGTTAGAPIQIQHGRAVFVPHGLFDFPLERMRAKSPYQVIELGLPYHMLRDVLKQIEDAVETSLEGLGDLSAEAIVQVTGLPYADAILAKQPEYDEPYLLQGPQALIDSMIADYQCR